jgi:AAA15 family ATPase/GTPase
MNEFSPTKNDFRLIIIYFHTIMFLQFSVNNFRSIKDTVTFSMNASSSPEGKHRFKISNHILLNSAVIYGANASGKSNLLKAMAFMRNLVLNTSDITQPTDELPHEPFILNTETEQASSYFEIILFLKDSKYRYGFEVDSNTIYSEWLYKEKKHQETCLFDRDTEKNNHYINKKKFTEGIDLTATNNQLFIWQCLKNNGAISQKITEWFKNFNLIDGLENEPYFHVALKRIENTSSKSKLLKLVKAAGLGIEDIVIEEQDITQDFIDNAPFSDEIKQEIIHEGNLTSIELKVQYKKFDAENKPIGTVLFDLNENESEGIKKFFALSAPVLDTLEQGKVLLVDQLDASLHPLLIECFINLFNNKKYNKYHAQLIFTAHNTNLLSVPKLFERDQIWFTEKDQYGSTELYSLLEFKKNDSNKDIKTADNLESYYLQGRYGAVPRLNELED